MTALAEVRERIEAGQAVTAIARELDLPLDLANQMVDHWRRLGVVSVYGVGGVSGGAGVGCADASRLHCAGCFFSEACPSSR